MWIDLKGNFSFKVYFDFKDPLRRGWSYGMLSCGKAGYFPDSCVKPAIVKRQE